MILYQHIFTVFLDTPTWGGYIYLFHDSLDMVINIFDNTSRKVFVVLTSHTEVENQFIKGLQGLKLIGGGSTLQEY